MRDIEKYFNDYVNMPFEDIQSRIRIKNIMEKIERYNPKSILEVGCGTDSIVKYYNEYKEVIIVEPSRSFVEILKNELRKGENIKIINNYIEDCKDYLKKYEYDFVIVSSLLHELEDPEKVIRVIYDIISEKTIVYANVPNANSLHRIIGKEMGVISNEYELSENNLKLQQKRVFDVQALQEIFVKNKYDIAESGSFFLKPFTHAQMHRILSGEIFPEKVIGALYNIAKIFPWYGSEIFVVCKKNKKVML